MAATLWIDVEDLFEYALHNPRPSGIQRVAFALYSALQAQHGDTGLIRFVRHDTARNTFYAVTWPEVAAMSERLTAGQSAPAAPLQVTAAVDPRKRSLRRLVHRLPPPVRASLIEAFRIQGTACRAWWKLACTTARSIRRPARARPADRDGFARQVVAGDIVLALGSPWPHPGYADLIAAERTRYGLNFALLVHDLSALRRPEWFDRGLVTSFRLWLDGILPLCDAVFAVSHATGADVQRYADESGIDLRGPVAPLPLATGLTDDHSPRAARLPEPGSYILFVSTIEARKNHVLLFRIWRRMLEELPRDAVPTLVFAGRVGWLVDDLMQQIINTDHLFGKLRIIEDASDADLAALYRGCLFTVYPSFFEGWGLPVTESLAFGKPCLISNRTSLPEAGGTLARYLDPDDLNEWHATICHLLEHRAELAEWEARIRREFKPVTWFETARALLAGLGHPLVAEIARPAAELAGSSSR